MFLRMSHGIQGDDAPFLCKKAREFKALLLDKSGTIL